MHMYLRKTFIAGAMLGAVGLSAPGQSRADIVQLGFILDDSGSISSSEWNVIRTGLATAIQNLVPIGGLNTYEISVVKFSTDATVVVNSVLIDSIATRNAVATTVGTMTQAAGWTNYAAGFNLMLDTITGSINYDPLGKQYINFATDGVPNRCGGAGTPVTTASLSVAQDCAVVARDAMIAAGIDNISIEGIGVSSSAATFLQSQICYPGPCDTTAPYNFPNQGFYIGVANAEGYADAIGNKIAIVTEQIPEPASLAILGIGLLGIGAARRLRR